MGLDQAFKRCAVLGAAGKMGRGIAALTLQQIAILEAKEYGSTGTGNFKLVLIDADTNSFPPIKSYLRDQLIKYAERNIVPLRQAFMQDHSVVSNEEVVDAFVIGAMDNILCSSALSDAADAELVFEALPEIIALKTQTLNKLKSLSQQKQYYFSNTSSIPIWLLDSQGNLEHQIVGLHFYNPPIIQKLMEISFPDDVDVVTKEYAEEISKRFGKTIVYTKDIPGFIGNGFFIREIAFACSMVAKLLPFMSMPGAIYAVDSLTRDFLVRPMGIFQLVDYVGTDVCENIATTIFTLLEDKSVVAELVAQVNEQGMRGGPGPDGIQKDGFFKYGPKSVPIAVFDVQQNSYVDLRDPRIEQVGQLLGPLPKGHSPWKSLSGRPDAGVLLQDYFKNLGTSETLGAQLAIEYLRACNAIAEALLEAQVASSADDINTVLKLGFHQLYGPLESWISPLLQKEARP